MDHPKIDVNNSKVTKNGTCHKTQNNLRRREQLPETTFQNVAGIDLFDLSVGLQVLDDNSRPSVLNPNIRNEIL